MQFGPRKQDALLNPTNEKSRSTEKFTAGSLIGNCLYAFAPGFFRF
jgi:hypothetical protein